MRQIENNVISNDKKINANTRIPKRIFLSNLSFFFSFSLKNFFAQQHLQQQTIKPNIGKRIMNISSIIKNMIKPGEIS
jgi:hypothetical protein